MFFIAEFSVIRPDWGLFFWAIVIFAIFWFFIGKFAFGPIADALEKRENDIQNALDQAKLAREEMQKLQADNEKLVQEAREERGKILKEAKDAKDAIIREAREQAKVEANKMILNAKVEIDAQKNAAIAEVKNQLGNMALDIAGKVIRKELTDDKDQIGFVDKLVDELNLN
jgi:F-type H+-transporting ATPase subunit b